MPAPGALPPRWSKKTDQLVAHIASRLKPSVQSELGRWLEGNSRFRDFITVHQDKVRKKLSGSDDEERRQDVRAELLVAYLLLTDRRFELAFEAYGAGRVGPDFTVTFRANQRFNLEVTRVQATGDVDTPRLANVIASKLRQLPAESANALVIVTHGLSVTEESVETANRLLKQHNDQNDEAFFTRRGFKSARDFYAQYLRLSGVFMIDEVVTTHYVANREARRPLPADAVAAVLTLAQSADLNRS